MRTFLFAMLAVIFFTSCTEYQYLTLSGDNISKNDKSEFETENDTLKITYHFDGYKGRIGITVYNKTNQPLEINWRKSFVIMKDKATSYFNSTEYVRGNIDTANKFLLGSPVANFSGHILVNEPVQYIPPKSFINKIPMTLLVDFLGLPFENEKKESFNVMPGYAISYKEISFEKEKSPIAFRSYLSFATGHDALLYEFAVEHKFYVSEVWQTSTEPTNFPGDWLNRGDKFYVRQQ
jgi:hypothetical protein